MAVAWLESCVAGINSGQAATTLPKDATSWADEGFVQAFSIPGAIDIDTPQRRTSSIQLDFWANTPNSNKPPWALAARLAELVRIATEDNAPAWLGKPLTLPPGFTGARVWGAYLTSDPARTTDDPSGYARFTADLALDWVRLDPEGTP